MDRKKRISLKGQIILSDRYESHLKEIEETYRREHLRMKSEYLDMWKWMLKKTKDLQRLGAKGKMGYMAISLLHSSFLTRSYDMRFDIYTKDLYLDAAEVCAYWCPALFFRYVQEDMEYFSCRVKKEIVQVGEDELREFEMEYAYRYARLAFSYFREMSGEIFKLEEYGETEKEFPVYMLFGNYIGKTTLIAQDMGDVV